MIWPLTHLPWPVFAVLWIGAEIATFGWLLAPLGWRWAVPLLLFCSFETALGNVYAWLAVATIAGLQGGSVWAFPILTKITLGTGVLWHAARGDWRRVAVAGTTTLVIVGLSAALDPQSWVEWFEFLRHTERVPAPLMPYRIALSGLIVVYAGRSGRPWLLAVVMLLASPVVGPNSLTVLAAVPRLGMGGRGTSRSLRARRSVPARQ